MEAPSESGVYQIRCAPTGKIYVGSAVNMRARWAQHRSQLRKGAHGNAHLQHAWAKYGEASFEFSVLEHAARDELLAREQYWIDKTQAACRESGFNIFDTAGSPGGTFARVYVGFIDPAGTAVPIYNLEEFCREHGLSIRVMRGMALGRRNRAHKGWTHTNSIRQRDFIKTHIGFIDPAGNNVAPITNLAEFCRQHGLDDTHMLAVARGKLCSHRGWTHVDARKPTDIKTYTGFINPEGQRVSITNLAEFCRQNGLHPVKMHNLKSGKIKQYKGWTWRGNTDHE
jgi:predicted GIY-YIG superfamily endonuclease